MSVLKSKDNFTLPLVYSKCFDVVLFDFIDFKKDIY